ncbi:MAG: cation acetate symporter [Pedosphaera sp.]|nr:cation acetate symporter [Pedosphaera sp.]
MPTSLLLAAVDSWILACSSFTVLATIVVGFWAASRSRTASDFFVAGRGVSVGWNASAISGEYLSAASFMGVAGMVMSSGYDALWYPVCYACGYLFLLLFIAGPLRRFGAYTIPDFAEGRYDSPMFRKIAIVFVLFIGFFYTMPQMKGAGTTLAYIFQDIAWFGQRGLPYWVGVVMVGAVITFNVALGGMKGITLVQAFQYWMKMFAIAVPVFVLLSVYGGYGKQLGVNVADPSVQSKQLAASPGANPPFQEKIETSGNSTRTGPQPARILPAKAPPDATWLAPFGPLTTKAARAAKLDPQSSRRLALLYTYSLIIALVCGTAGLPHILVRFYTNPDGMAAKRTTMWVMILIGVFYIFPPMFGVLGRNLMPELYNGLTGVKGTDGIVLRLPTILRERFGVLGSVLSGITCAGAFAAFMSTFSGLLVSMTGALAHDVYGRILRPSASAADRMRMFKWCAISVGVVAVGLGCLAEDFEINFMVGQAFAIAAASYFPLLFMSIWWRGMTVQGAATGMLTGGLFAMIAISMTSFTTFVTTMSAKYSGKPMPDWLAWMKAHSLEAFWAAHPLQRILCEQPALWAVPLAITLMVVVSKLTTSSIPLDIRMKMLVLHAPEKLGLKQEYIREHESAH